jgi:hypothetical protein
LELGHEGDGTWGSKAWAWAGRHCSNARRTVSSRLRSRATIRLATWLPSTHTHPYTPGEVAGGQRRRHSEQGGEGRRCGGVTEQDGHQQPWGHVAGNGTAGELRGRSEQIADVRPYCWEGEARKKRQCVVDEGESEATGSPSRAVPGS